MLTLVSKTTIIRDNWPQTDLTVREERGKEVDALRDRFVMG